MDFLLTLVLIAVVIILLVKKSGSGPNLNFLIDPLQKMFDELKDLKKEIRQLKQDVQEGREELKNLLGNTPLQQYTPPPPGTVPPPEEPVPPPVIQEQPRPVVYADALPEIKPVEEVKEEQVPEAESEIAIAAFAADANLAEPAALSATPTPPPAYQPREDKIDKWFRNNPDLEKFIGENLINKIGIAVLVLGIAFFVKYAIDKDWINEVGRVCIGLGCGAILVGVAHYMRNSYRSFSSVLAGGGIAVFYFTIAFGFHQYHLMSQSAAFIIMVVITAFAIALSVLYNKLELAVIATIGGFLAPFLVSTGDGNYIVLFTYLIILNIGVLSLAYFKRWPAINIIALAFTEIIFGGWLMTVYNNTSKTFSYPLAFVFATAFYFIFLGMNLVHQMRNKLQFKAFDFIILLVISSSYFAAGIVLMHSWNNGAYQGLFTLGLGVVNLLLAYYVYKKGRPDRNLLFLLIGITLTFITLTIPIQLHGHAITLFWSAEFVLLYWLSEYSGIRIFKYSSLLICGLTIISLFMDWQQASAIATPGLPVIFNNLQGIVTNVVAIVAFAVWYYLLRKNEEGTTAGTPNKYVATMAITVSVALLYVTCIFGVNLYFHTLSSFNVPNVYHRMITEVFVLAFFIAVRREKGALASWLKFCALVVCFLVLVGSATNVADLRDDVLAGKEEWMHFIAHWADSLLMGILFYKTIQTIRNNPDTFKSAAKALSIILTIMIISFLSMELAHIYVIAGHSGNNTYQLVKQYNKAGLTVLWGISSFILMWLGMKHSAKQLRIISLVLFGIVLLKLFILDISGISEGGKILAFILLGVLLLIVSFMYQKLKKIIIDDKAVHKDETEPKED